jgi:hypothetical protein
MTIRLINLVVPNPHEFKLEGQNITFERGYKNSFILKEGISNGILEVFALCQ